MHTETSQPYARPSARDDGRVEEARAAYATAARLVTSIPEQRYLNTKAAQRALV
jgi:predicted RNA polymerase sigma factor